MSNFWLFACTNPGEFTISVIACCITLYNCVRVVATRNKPEPPESDGNHTIYGED